MTRRMKMWTQVSRKLIFHHKWNRNTEALPLSSYFFFLSYVKVESSLYWESINMADLMQLKRRYETVRVTEDSKDKIIEVCSVYMAPS